MNIFFYYVGRKHPLYTHPFIHTPLYTPLFTFFLRLHNHNPLFSTIHFLFLFIIHNLFITTTFLFTTLTTTLFLLENYHTYLTHTLHIPPPSFLHHLIYIPYTPPHLLPLPLPHHHTSLLLYFIFEILLNVFIND